jgi:signal transduction histidine kinase
MIPASPVIANRQEIHSPVSEIVAALKRIVPLQGLAEDEFLWLATRATEYCIPGGTTLFHDGDPASEMLILVRGEIHVRRSRGLGDSLFIGRSGQITGLLPFSRMKTYGGQGYTTADTWALSYPKEMFPEMLAAIPSLANRLVGVLLDRVREVTRIEQQTEKLAALGKLAGNLAHELNNPASAAQRAAGGILGELRVYGNQKFRLGTLCLDDEKLRQVQRWQLAVREASRQKRAPDAIESSASEDLITKWLGEHGVEDTWKISSELAELGVTPEQLEPLSTLVDTRGLSVVLAQFASSIRAERMTEAMIDSTARIFDLIRAIKDYSYMDQAPIQEVDVRQGLENTLTMLQSRLQYVQITRDYAEDLPCINAYGSELNQVWTALIENALDAIQDHGEIQLKVNLSGDLMLVEVWDNGPGIPPELKDRVFEPFFTTKAPGRGLGLGLDQVTRTVRKHRGYVRVQSAPGATCFQVRLPLEQLQAY